MAQATDDRQRLLERIDAIIARLQRLQAGIIASRQPPAGYELDELRRLGIEYGELIARLEAKGQDS